MESKFADKEKAKEAVQGFITWKIKEILSTKDSSSQYLTFNDFYELTGAVKNFWEENRKNRLSQDNLQKEMTSISFACNVALAVVAPSNQERIKILKQAIAGISGLGGVAAIISAVALVLGWGAGVTATITAFFVGASVGEPLCLVLAGLTLVGIAAYFMVNSDNPTEQSRKAEEVLRESLKKAIDENWQG